MGACIHVWKWKYNIEKLVVLGYNKHVLDWFLSLERVAGISFLHGHLINSLSYSYRTSPQMLTQFAKKFFCTRVEDFLGGSVDGLPYFPSHFFLLRLFLHNSSVGKLGMESTPPFLLPPDLVVTWKWFLAPLVCRRRFGLNCARCILHSHERLLAHIPVMFWINGIVP